MSQNKIKIISKQDPKTLSFYFMNIEKNKWQLVSSESELSRAKFKDADIIKSGKEIISAIDRGYNIGGQGVDIQFQGAEDECSYLVGIIAEHFRDKNIECNFEAPDVIDNVLHTAVLDAYAQFQEPENEYEHSTQSIAEYHKVDLEGQVLENILDQLSLEKEKRIGEIKAFGDLCIHSYTKKAEKIGWIPTVCIPIVHGYCISMIAELHEIVGINSTKGFASDIFINVILGAFVTPFMAIPIISAAAASSYIETVGTDYLALLMNIISRSTNAELKNNELMTERIKEELQKRKK